MEATKELIAYIYLLQDGEHKNTNVFKIGRTIQSSHDTRRLKRIQSYSQGTQVRCLVDVPVGQVVIIEKKLIELFKTKYKLVRGYEWFEGDIAHMKRDIHNFVDNLDDNLAMITSDYACIEDLDIDDSPKQSQGSDHLESCSLNNTNQTQKKVAPGKFPCSTCYKCFTRKAHLDNHTDQCLGVISPFQCYKCKLILSSRNTKCKHLKRCKAPEPTREELLKYKQSQTTVQKEEHMCHMCDAKFTNKYNCKRHILHRCVNRLIINESSDVNDETDIDIKNNEESSIVTITEAHDVQFIMPADADPCICMWCSVTFTNKYNCRRHMISRCQSRPLHVILST